MEGLGIRCVSDEPWVTASETAECALAYATIGDLSTATDLLRVDPHAPPGRRRRTGPVSCIRERELFPPDEHSSYTAAAVLLAVDGITQTHTGVRPVRPAPRLTRHDRSRSRN